MGLNFRGGIKALADAGVGIGQQMMQDERRQEERQYQEDRELRKEEIEERRWKAQREDARIRNQQLKTQTMINRMKYDNDQLVKAALVTEFDAAKLVPVINKHANTGYAFRHNPAASEVISEQSLEGNEGIAFDVGVWEEDSEGNPVIGDDGKKKFIKLPGELGLQTWQNKADFTNWYSNLSSPGDTWARYNREKSSAQILKEATEKQKMQDESASGKASIELTKAKTKEIKEKTGTPKTGASSFRSVSGVDRKQSSQDVEKAKQFAGFLNKSGSFTKQLHADDAARIMDIENDPNAQKMIESYLNTLTEEEFKDKFRTNDAKLPPEYVQKMWDEGQNATGGLPKEGEPNMWDNLKSWIKSMVVE